VIPASRASSTGRHRRSVTLPAYLRVLAADDRGIRQKSQIAIQ
jgi:hypothetical protein